VGNHADQAEQRLEMCCDRDVIFRVSCHLHLERVLYSFPACSTAHFFSIW
jgi:hypothetical protein